jgi:hypothetical protein
MTRCFERGSIVVDIVAKVSFLYVVHYYRYHNFLISYYTSPCQIHSGLFSLFFMISQTDRKGRQAGIDKALEYNEGRRAKLGQNVEKRARE